MTGREKVIKGLECKVLPMSRTILIKKGEAEDKVWYTLPARTEDRATLRSDLSADPSHGRAAQQCRSFSRRAKGRTREVPPFRAQSDKPRGFGGRAPEGWD